jgi:hypothetical protein
LLLAGARGDKFEVIVEKGFFFYGIYATKGFYFSLVRHSGSPNYSVLVSVSFDGKLPPFSLLPLNLWPSSSVRCSHTLALMAATGIRPDRGKVPAD